MEILKPQEINFSSDFEDDQSSRAGSVQFPGGFFFFFFIIIIIIFYRGKP